MSWKNFRASVDKNQNQIVKDLRAIGCSVWLINGVIDIIVGFQGRSFIFEIKNPESKTASLKDSQIEFIENWKGSPVYIVETFDDILDIIKGNKTKADCHDKYLTKKQKTRDKNINNKSYK